MSSAEKIALENYRAADRAGLLMRLPVPLGAKVWQICKNPAWNSGVESAEKFLFGEAQTFFFCPFLSEIISIFFLPYMLYLEKWVVK